MVTKVQHFLNSLQTADPFETWHKNRSSLKVVLFVFKIFKMATNIRIKKIVKNSKIKRFQWKWIFTGSKTCCTILRPFRFAMVAILNPKWPPKYKNPPIWAKFGFQVDYDVANCYRNFRGMLSTMSRCADYFRNFQNRCHCHGNPGYSIRLYWTGWIVIWSGYMIKEGVWGGGTPPPENVFHLHWKWCILRHFKVVYKCMKKKVS
jgi:hypothetical protein